METKFNEWVEETSTKMKEQQLLDYLTELGQTDEESKRFVDLYLFDEDNIPISNPDVVGLFDDLGIDVSSFIEFISEREYDE